MAVATAGDEAGPKAATRPRRVTLAACGARLAREPLVHFLLLGALIFAAITGVRALDRPTVALDAQDLAQLVDYWQLQAGRAPTPVELRAMIRERVDEELLAREAERLGLGRGDLIIRRRLAQKMSFAAEDTAERAVPGEAELRAYFQAHVDRYAEPERAALRHVFFSADRGEAAAHAAAVEAMAAARAGRVPLEGDPSLLPLTYADVSLRDLARDYGADFVKAARSGPVGAWRGPVRSPFGWHLIRVERRMAAQPPAFETVRAQVRDDLSADRRKAAAETFLAKLRARYRVKVAGAAP